MSEAVAALMTLLVMTVAVWMVDFAGTVGLGAGRARVGAERAATSVIDAVTADPGLMNDLPALDGIASRAAVATTIGACVHSDPAWDMDLAVVTDHGTDELAGVVVTVTCPVRTAGFFADSVTVTAAEGPVP